MWRHSEVPRITAQESLPSAQHHSPLSSLQYYPDQVTNFTNPINKPSLTVTMVKAGMLHSPFVQLLVCLGQGGVAECVRLSTLSPTTPFGGISYTVYVL